MKVWIPSPMKCFICGFYACHDDLPVCRRCLPKLQIMLTQRCGKCGEIASVCQCEKNSRSLLFYDTYESKKLIYFFKTNADRRFIKFMAELAVKVCGIKPQAYDAITYIPRLPKNIRRYGYDQSKELAQAISRLYGIPLITALKRNRGRDQKLLSHSERIKNIKGRYILMPVPQEKYRRLLLIDDVSTTGATIDACSDLLRGSFAKSVTALVLAKTILNKQ